MQKTVNLEFPDKTRRLRFDSNAFADLEEYLGMGFKQLMKKELSFAFLRALVWAGLKWEERGLTIERAGNLVHQYLTECGDKDELGIKITEAVKASGLFKEDPKNLEAEAVKKEE